MSPPTSDSLPEAGAHPTPDPGDDAPVPGAGVDLVRSIVAPWQHGDFSALGWADPDIEYVLADGPSPGRWTGLADMSAAFYDVLSPFRDYRVVVEEIRELDDERVLVLHRYRGVGKTSGLQIGEIASRGANLFHLRDGRVARLVIYWGCERALADLRSPGDGRRDGGGGSSRIHAAALGTAHRGQVRRGGTGGGWREPHGEPCRQGGQRKARW